MKDTRNDQVSAANNNYSLLALADSEDERERMVFSTAIPSCSFLLWSSLSSAISSNTRPPSRAYRLANFSVHAYVLKRTVQARDHHVLEQYLLGGGGGGFEIHC